MSSSQLTQLNSTLLTLPNAIELCWVITYLMRVMLSVNSTDLNSHKSTLNSTNWTNTHISTQLYSTQMSSSPLTQHNSALLNLSHHNTTQLYSTSHRISTQLNSHNSTHSTHLTSADLNSAQLTQHNSQISSQFHSTRMSSSQLT